MKPMNVFLATTLMIAGPALAQQPQAPSTMPGMMMPNAGAGPYMREQNAAMMKMMQDMSAMKMTGNADHDFMMSMRSHHQAAIDMAKSVLSHGKDQQVRKLANEIVEAQQKEIAFIDDWMRKHPM